MKHDRKKRLIELRDAHYRQTTADVGTEGRGSARLGGTDVNGFLREIVKRKQQRKQQRAVIEDFFENPSAYSVDTSFMPATATQAERDARKEELAQKLDKVRAVYEALEDAMKVLTGGDGAAGAIEDRTRVRVEVADDDVGGSDSVGAAQGSATAEEQSCRLEVCRTDEESEQLELGRDKVLIGRRSVNDVCLRDRAVSGRHALIVPDGASWLLVDLGSTNGTQVNGSKIHLHALADRDEIRIGHCVLVFRASHGEASSPPDVDDEVLQTVVIDESEHRDR